MSISPPLVTHNTTVTQRGRDASQNGPLYRSQLCDAAVDVKIGRSVSRETETCVCVIGKRHVKAGMYWVECVCNVEMADRYITWVW